MTVSAKNKIISALLSTSAALALSACGGGGADGSTLFTTPTPAPAATPTPTPGGTTPTPTPVPAPPLPSTAAHVALQVDCSGANCSATDANNMAATNDAGVWTYSNTGTDAVAVDISISGTSERDGTLVVSNTSASPVNMYNIPNAQIMKSQRVAPLATVNKALAPLPPPNVIPASVRNFKEPSLKNAHAMPSHPLVQTHQHVAYNVGDSRTWFDADHGTHLSTLIQRFNAGDGRQVNVWVENTEFGTDTSTKVTAADVSALGTAFASGTSSGSAIYTMDTSLLGQPWGTYPAAGASVLIPASEPIDIVVLNINPKDGAFGTVGYFANINNFLNSGLTGSDKGFSNEALAFFMDSQTIYLARTGSVVSGLDFELSTLAHEFTHMINFYQRDVLLDQTFDNDTWLEEMTAMGMEDIVDSQINPAYNAVRDARFPDWLTQGGYNCSLDAYNSDLDNACFSYSIGGSFMGYLTRQYGVANFYQKLGNDQSSTNSYTRLDNVIRAAAALTPGTPANLADALRHWHASPALFSATPPASFGYPARTEVVNGITYSLPGIARTADYLTALGAGIPTFTPQTLQPHAMHLARRKGLASVWAESVAVPAGTTLTVVVTP